MDFILKKSFHFMFFPSIQKNETKQNCIYSYTVGINQSTVENVGRGFP